MAILKIKQHDGTWLTIGDSCAWIVNEELHALSSHNTNTVTNDYAIATGLSTSAMGLASFTEGRCTTASGDVSHAEGDATTASGSFSHAEGSHTIAAGENSHAEGYYTETSGNQSHAEGIYSKATQVNAHAEGCSTVASGHSSHAEGYNTTASGNSAHAEGEYTQASGYYSHAAGFQTVSAGRQSHAEGYKTLASGESAHAEGNQTKAAGDNSHAEGESAIADGSCAHAEGYDTLADGDYSHAEGYKTIADGIGAHAEGYMTETEGDNAHAEGRGTYAGGAATHVQGRYNIGQSTSSKDVYGTYAHILGNGGDIINRSNAHTIDWSGNAWFAGDVYVGSTSGKNKDTGSKKLATEEQVASKLDIYNNTTAARQVYGTVNGQQVMVPVSTAEYTASALVSRDANGFINTKTPTAATQAANKEYVDSIGNTKIPYKAVIQNTNPFGGKQLYINSIDNAFAAIDKKFYVQITYHKRFDDNGVEYPHVKEGAAKTDADYWVDGPITSTSGFNKNNNDLFNGNYEGGLRIATNGYAKIHVRFSNEEGWTPSTGKAVNSVYGSYPYGTFYISYYYQNHPDLNKRSQYRCYNNGATHGYGWKKQDFTIFNKNSDGITNIIESCSDEGSNQRTCMEFIIFSDDTTKAGPVEIEWKMTRPSFASNTPLLTNYGANRVYWPMYFKQKMQGDNQVAITPEGTITASSYIKAPVFKGAMEGKLVLGDKTYDGSSTVTIPVNDFAKKAELDNYLLKTGGTVAGNLSIAGDLTIQGNTYTQDNETIRIADNIIELNSTKQNNATALSGIAINKDDNSTYGIMYDPTSDTVKLGEGKTENGAFTFNNEEGAPLTVRDDSSNIADGAIMIFDKSKNRLVDSGYTIDGFKQWVKDYIEIYMSTTREDNDADGETLNINTDNYTEENGTLTIGG